MDRSLIYDYLSVLLGSRKILPKNMLFDFSLSLMHSCYSHSTTSQSISFKSLSVISLLTSTSRKYELSAEEIPFYV